MLLIVLAFGWWQARDQDTSSDRVPAGGSSTVEVDRVVDGDTAKVFYEGDSEYVRYIGIDTPESVKPGTEVQCFGKESTAFNAEAIEGKRVKLVFDQEKRDRYDRLLAYVYVDGRLLNAEILRRGYGTTLEISPNTSKASQFRDLEDEARAADRGLWSAC
ncbi:MAG: thermonuclease family protein [Solirubrobacterales bacterium]